MVTAIDSSVLYGLLKGDSTGDPEQLISEAQQQGRLVICETVAAEVAAIIQEKLPEFLDDLGIEVEPTSPKALIHAGKLFRKHIQSGGKRTRVIADYIIGSHALHHADRILSYDRGFFRSSFRNLKVIPAKGYRPRP